MAKSLQLILEISATYRLLSYLLDDLWPKCRLHAQCMIYNGDFFRAILCLSLSPFQKCIIQQLLDSTFVICGKIKVSASAFGSADNTYFDLDYSGYKKKKHLIQ